MKGKEGNTDAAPALSDLQTNTKLGWIKSVCMDVFICREKMLKWLRFDIAFNIALLEVWFGRVTPNVGNNEEHLIHHNHTGLNYTSAAYLWGISFPNFLTTLPHSFSNALLCSLWILSGDRVNLAKPACTSLYLCFVWCSCLNSLTVQAQIADWNEVGSKNSPFVAHILFDPQVITAYPPFSFSPWWERRRRLLGVTDCGGMREWHSLSVEWHYWEPANHGWVFFTWH